MIARIDFEPRIRVDVRMLQGPLKGKTIHTSIPERLKFLKHYTFSYEGVSYHVTVMPTGERRAVLMPETDDPKNK